MVELGLHYPDGHMMWLNYMYSKCRKSKGGPQIFYKMDKSSIQVLGEDLTEEVHALAQTHTTTIRTFLEKFNDDQLLLAIEADRYECERL